MQKMAKLLAVIVCSVFMFTSMGQTILAADNTVKVLQVHEDARKAIEKELQANPDKVKADIEYSKKLTKKGSSPNFAAAVVATYFIPGIGEVALLATGAVLVGGIAIVAGTWLWNKIQSWISNHDGGEADVSNRTGWKEVEDEEEILEEENGEVGSSHVGEDDTKVEGVFDKDTGNKIGEIHEDQPEYINNDRSRPTGKKYPKHYERWYRTSNGGRCDSSMHWWWK